MLVNAYALDTQGHTPESQCYAIIELVMSLWYIVLWAGGRAHGRLVGIKSYYPKQYYVLFSLGNVVVYSKRQE